MMTRVLRISVFGGLMILGGISARAQELGPIPEALPAAGAIEAAPIADNSDASTPLPVGVDIYGVNGLTDRFGMPLVGQFLKGTAEVAEFGQAPVAEPVATPRPAVVRTKSILKRAAVKPKEAKRLPKPVMSSTGAVPQYYIPRGSLNWAAGEEPISLSPADPYGYGHGNSGYGTEVFGDFWKGWPTVQ